MSEATENAVWVLLTELTITHARLRPLIERLEQDFGAEAGGYQQLHALADEEQRAVVSDQIGQSARAIRDNLVEARLHQHQLERIVPSAGIRFPEQTAQRATILERAQMDMEITGCVRALGSALDCLAAVAIGTLRMPFSIQRATFSDLSRAVSSKTLAAATPEQQRLWEAMTQLCEAHRQKPPSGWLDWLNGMRNLNVHRARQVHILLQRTRDPNQPQLLVVDQDPVALTKQTARFDLHLRRRPAAPDMYDFIASPATTELWLNERATTTLPAMVLMVNELVEEASQFLLGWWDYASGRPALFPPPAKAWALASDTGKSFDGVAPATNPLRADVGMVGPHMTERLALAERLRHARRV